MYPIDHEADVGAVERGREVVEQAAPLVRSDGADDGDDVARRPGGEIGRDRLDGRAALDADPGWDERRADSRRALECEIADERGRRDHDRGLLERGSHVGQPFRVRIRHAGQIERVRIDEQQIVQRDDVRQRERVPQRRESRTAVRVHAVQVHDADAGRAQPALRDFGVDVRAERLAQRMEPSDAELLHHVHRGADMEHEMAPRRARREIADVPVGAAARRRRDVQDGGIDGFSHRR